MHTLIARSLVAAVALAAAPTAAAEDVGTAAIAHPTSRTAVVVRVASGGGFVAPQATLGAVHAFTLYGDGTVIVPGPVPQISPGPAITPLLRSHLSEHQMQALLLRAKRAGLLAQGTISYGDMGSVGVSDMPTTTVTLNAAGRMFVRRAYALGALAHGNRMPPAQAKARRELAGFIAGLPHGLAGARYVPRGVAVFVTPSSGPAQPGGRPIAWPLATDLATAGKPTSPTGYRCIAVHGADARRLLTRLRTATNQSRWTAQGKPGTLFALVFRPLLPDEQGCASLS
jgi:hypothetical protein